MLVKELSDKAMEVMKSMDYQPCTITSIYSSSIRPILDYYLAEGIEEYDPNLRSQIETMYLEQYREGTISRSTYYKRLRGTDIFDAVHETGAYEWRKHASDVIAPVQSYSGTISEHLSTRNRKGGCHDRKWLTDNFLEAWNSIKPSGSIARVRVYDLRHRFATTLMMKIADEGMDPYSFIPYMSAYMGHIKFDHTMYYIHLLPEKLADSKSIDWGRMNGVIPEVEMP